MPELNGPFRLPPSGAAPDSLVVLLHGIGANGDDLIGLADVLAERFPETAFHAPDAPERHGHFGPGYQWFPRDRTPESFRRARESQTAVNAYVDALLDGYGLAPERCVLAGFSQGAMLALHTGPRRDRRLAGVIGMSGILLTADTLEAEARSRPPFLLVHGEQDEVVPSAETERSHRILSELGFDVEAYVLPGLAHSIDARALGLAAAFMQRVLG